MLCCDDELVEDGILNALRSLTGADCLAEIDGAVFKGKLC